MTAFRLFPAIITICSASSAFGTTPKCDIDLTKLQESRSDATTIKVAVQRTACASIGDGGSLTVSDTQALVADVIEWKELGEEALGRPMTAIEWQQLVDDARSHGRTVSEKRHPS